MTLPTALAAAPEGLPVSRLGDLDEPPPSPRWLVEPLWGRAAVGFVAGQPKLGKTWLALDLALSVATDTPCLDQFPVTDPGDVLVYLAEDHPSVVRSRLAGLCRHRGLRLSDVPLHVITAPTLRLDLDADRRRLLHTVASLRPRLLVLDPLVRLHRRNENDAGDVAELLAFLRDLQRTRDLAILVVHHMRKGGAGHSGQALRGSGDFHAWIDSGLYLRTRHQQVLLTVEHRNAPAPDPIEIHLTSRPDGSQTRLQVAPHQDHDPPEAQGGLPAPLPDRLVGELQAVGRPLSRIELRRRLRSNNQRLGQALDDLHHRGIIQRSPQGWMLVAPVDPSFSSQPQHP